MRPPVRVLIIEDDEDDVLLAREYLSESENFLFEIDWEPDPDKAREKMIEGLYEVFLIDYRLGGETGIDLIKFAQDNGVIAPCILLTGQGDEKVDLDATRFGAADYLVKTDLNASMLERSIRYALSQARVIRELDEKEKRYRSLFERSLDPIFLADEKLIIVDVNDSFVNFFRVKKEEALGQSIGDLFVNKQDYEYFNEMLKKSEQVRDYEVTLANKLGEKKGSLMNCVFIPDLASEFCCYQGIIHDLTLRKKAERDMLIAERLSMTGKIARTIAHEVRNPLTNLNLALEQLKDEMPKSESAKLYSDIIERNADRIEQLIGEMLSSSKPRDLDLQLIHVADILEETIGLTVDRLNLSQIRLEKNYNSNGLPRILVDKEKIKIAFLNIVINAVEAMEPGTGVLKIDAKLSDGNVVVSITDNGKGIQPDDVEKLFDPFYTGKAGGMGLGLTSTKNILSSHSASVEVISTPGSGTTFFIYFKLPPE